MKAMRILELFSGTGSIGKIAKEFGYTEIVSLDLDPRSHATITGDIMAWDYKAAGYPVGHFDVIWASPPCTSYSCMNNIHKNKRDPVEFERKLQASDAIVQRTLDIIEYFKPPLWFMENPATGMLKERDVVKGIPFVDTHYCKYGYPYPKRTRIWSTAAASLSLRKCKFDCGFVEPGKRKHICRIGETRTDRYSMTPYEACAANGYTYNLDMRHSIPPDLVRSILPRPPRLTPLVIKIKKLDPPKKVVIRIGARLVPDPPKKVVIRIGAKKF